MWQYDVISNYIFRQLPLQRRVVLLQLQGVCILLITWSNEPTIFKCSSCSFVQISFGLSSFNPVCSFCCFGGKDIFPTKTDVNNTVGGVGLIVLFVFSALVKFIKCGDTNSIRDCSDAGADGIKTVLDGYQSLIDKSDVCAGRLNFASRIVNFSFLSSFFSNW